MGRQRLQAASSRSSREWGRVVPRAAWLGRLYAPRDVVAGLLIFGIGDSIAALIAGQQSAGRLVGVSLTGALLYGLEVPHYFRWIARRTANDLRVRAALLRTVLAIAYFNPLWIARHLALLAVWQGRWVVDPPWMLLETSARIFATALPVTLIANLLIQNVVPLRYRFIASSLFSCAMAIFYPIAEAWLGGAPA